MWQGPVRPRRRVSRGRAVDRPHPCGRCQACKSCREVCGIGGEGEEAGGVHELPDDGIEGEEFGKRMPVKMQDPKLPSPEEEREHLLTHLPYRSWCVHCVRGKGRAKDHRRQGDGERRVPEVHLDYCFLGSAVDARPKTVWVAKDRESRMVMASLVPSKGASKSEPSWASWGTSKWT